MSKKFRTSAILGLTTISLFPFSTPVWSATETEQAHVFAQRHSERGPVVIAVARSGLKIDLLRQKVTIVASPPDWKMTIYNPAVKTKYERSFKMLEKMPLYHIRPPKTSMKVVGRQASEDRGVPVIVHIADSNFTLGGDFFDEQTPDPSKRPKVDRVYILGFHDKDDKIPDQAERFLSALFDVPSDVGLILAVRFRYVSGGKASIIETEKKSMKACQPKDFIPPAGLRLVKSEYDVISDNRTDMLADWALDMGLGEQKGDRSKKKK